MAVENKYVISNLANDLPADHPVEAGGAHEKVMAVPFAVAAADDDGSIYRVAKGISSDRRLIDAYLYNDAITAATDYDFGGYKGLDDGGAVIDKDAFADGIDIASGNAVGSPQSLITALAPEEVGQPIYEALGQTEGSRTHKVDLALTANTVGSAAGDICVIMEFA